MKKPIAIVTDHAVLRYLERVQGVDVESARLELGFMVDDAVRQGALATVADGIRYVLVDGRLVTCVAVKSVSLRNGRRRRSRAVEDAEE